MALQTRGLVVKSTGRGCRRELARREPSYETRAAMARLMPAAGHKQHQHTTAHAQPEPAAFSVRRESAQPIGENPG